MSARAIELIIFSTAFGTAFVLAMVFRRYALARSLVDVPNDRSSHPSPTPRGGGVAIVLPFLAGLPVLFWAGLIPFSVMVGLVGAGALAASVGFADDHRDIPARWRLVAHFVAAMWVLAWLEPIPALPVFGEPVTLGRLDLLFLSVYLVWMLNLYNFMDGIDGLASVQAVTMCLGGFALYW